MFDVQAWFARDVILGKIKNPSKDEREKDMQSWSDRLATLPSSTEVIRYQMDYVKDLKKVNCLPSLISLSLPLSLSLSLLSTLPEYSFYLDNCFYVVSAQR